MHMQRSCGAKLWSEDVAADRSKVRSFSAGTGSGYDVNILPAGSATVPLTMHVYFGERTGTDHVHLSTPWQAPIEWEWITA